VGGHYSYALGHDLWCPDVGAFARLRWTRLAYLSATVGPRLGIVDAENYGQGGYRPILGGNVDAGWTWRTKGGSGLLVGGGVWLLLGQLRLDGIVYSRDNGPVRPRDGLPIPGWAGPGKHDVTLSLGGQMWLMPQYYLLLTEQDVAPPPDPVTTSPRTE
jgi:hypothetical protein